ncbi:hypothetical protein TNIN_286871 [Trichonephila inaurata madagascariensis]|uniref:Uncharacterized protein n=1 Tax=Trichonephila inaurata madagascariensis TaxID=2747483 RepID=A0A8X6WTZ4_9ARAC|nr:hypothetical protein TNIN_286871 [Trichonephila inaurata madagascariensis]
MTTSKFRPVIPVPSHAPAPLINASLRIGFLASRDRRGGSKRSSSSSKSDDMQKGFRKVSRCVRRRLELFFTSRAEARAGV